MESAVKINVGGRVFAVEDQVLRSRGENMITRLLYNTAENGMEKSVDDEGNLFISGDPETFAVILDFLRLGKLHIPYNISWTRMQAELDYYCIDASASPKDASLCDKVEEGFYSAAEDENFGAKLKQYAIASRERLAKEWFKKNKKFIVDKLVEAASQGQMQMASTVVPIKPLSYSWISSDLEASRVILDHMIRTVESIGIRVTLLQFRCEDYKRNLDDRVILSASWDNGSNSEGSARDRSE